MSIKSQYILKKSLTYHISVIGIGKIHTMYTIEERIEIVAARLRGQSYEEVRNRFERKFRKPAPTRGNIQILVNKFMRTGSVRDEPRTGRPSISVESVEAIQNAIERSPQASTRRLSRELGIPRSSVWKVLRFTLKKRAYHLQVVQKLEAEDYAARRAMCYDLCEAADRENLMGHILFTDEATFHVCGRVHRHNCRIWADEMPHDTMEWERHSPKVNVWLGLTKRKVYGPYMFAEQTITGDMYLDMLQLFLHPQLLQDGIIDTVVLQQDGAPPHFALTVRAYLNDMFPNRWIGRASPRMWAPRSPDFTPLDFFAWGFIKQQVYRTKVPNLQVLKERIRQASAMITEDMLVNVFQATVRRWETCFEIDGGHVEH